MSNSIWPLEIRGLTVERGGEHLLGPLDLDIGSGPAIVVLGPNGAGKSLLLRCLHGLVAPSHGTIRWGSVGFEEARKRQGMVFQRPVMLRRSARANVEYALAVRGWSRGERRARAHELLARTGLGPIAERPARVLSAGEQQRLSIARAWAIDPEVLLLDEPTAALDPSATVAVEHLITTIAEAGTRILMVSHDLGQARRIADEILFLDRGRVAERARARDFFDSPSTEAARAFLRGELLWD